ncbi:MAG: GIY-YIG nuclease family protein [Syntrophales bacterium LBB04]|nr:GIY-YIG nuclease family protein [Syntrophales bacterium LBB04]
MTKISNQGWQVYMILCSDNSLYTGITTDVERRYREHQAGKGAKYFRGRQPVRLIYLKSGHDLSSAIRREANIKGMKRNEKLLLISSDLNEIESAAPEGKVIQ